MPNKMKKKRKDEYDDKLKVKDGTTFLDLVKSSVKDANQNIKKQK